MSLKKQLIIAAFLILMIGASILNVIDQTGHSDLTFIQMMFYGIINVMIVSVVMMIIPISIRLYKRGTLEYSYGKKISFFNSLLLFLIPTILAAINIIESGYVDIISALAFYYINLWLITMGTYQADETF